ncbi:MAG: DUF6464 family protein [Thermostichales cyanobacterium BF3_bins_165]
MDPSLPVQIIDSLTGERLEILHLADVPHPGQHLDIAGTPFTILEKRHSYHLRDGRYRLYAVRLFVQTGTPPQGLGDLSCLYNAHSPLLRCAVHPLGPCEGCRDYRPR